jgi:hypothetical protein
LYIISVDLKNLFRNDPSGKSIYERQLITYERTKLEIEKKRKEKEEAELDGATFIPSLSEGTVTMTQKRSSSRDRDESKFFSRLYSESSIISTGSNGSSSTVTKNHNTIQKKEELQLLDRLSRPTSRNASRSASPSQPVVTPKPKKMPQKLLEEAFERVASQTTKSVERSSFNYNGENSQSPKPSAKKKEMTFDRLYSTALQNAEKVTSSSPVRKSGNFSSREPTPTLQSRTSSRNPSPTNQRMQSKTVNNTNSVHSSKLNTDRTESLKPKSLVGNVNSNKSLPRSSTPSKRQNSAATANTKLISRSSTPSKQQNLTTTINTRTSTPSKQQNLTTTTNTKSILRSSTPLKQQNPATNTKSISRSSTPSKTQNPTATSKTKSISGLSTPTKQLTSIDPSSTKRLGISEKPQNSTLIKSQSAGIQIKKTVPSRTDLETLEKGDQQQSPNYQWSGKLNTGSKPSEDFERKLAASMAMIKPLDELPSPVPLGGGKAAGLMETAGPPPPPFGDSTVNY